MKNTDLSYIPIALHNIQIISPAGMTYIRTLEWMVMLYIIAQYRMNKLNFQIKKKSKIQNCKVRTIVEY